MTYYGDYGFDHFLSVGAENDKEIENFVIKRLLKGLNIDLGITGAGCTAFITKDHDGNILFARNFDFVYAPSLVVKTRPKNGYASVSVANLAFAGYTKDWLPNGIISSFLTLGAPYIPFDKKNKKGLAIALLAVPEVMLSHDPSKITLNTTTIIRLILDKAAAVDEAVSLIHEYNIYFSGGINCHYFIADKNGKSVIVEFWDGGIQVINENVASNFVAYNELNIGEGFTEFERYEKVKLALNENNDIMSKTQTVELLNDVGVYDEGEDKLQWSVIYNLSKPGGLIFANRNIQKIYVFQLK
jgi:penicillin V acylase-like amidase (Ntn superfamily)